MLYEASIGEGGGYLPYGETVDKEVVPNWLTY